MKSDAPGCLFLQEEEVLLGFLFISDRHYTSGSIIVKNPTTIGRLQTGDCRNY